MPAQKLRDYQTAGITAIMDAWKSGKQKVLATAPTGSGKTTIFCSLASDLTTKVLILVHRRELAMQASDRLREFGVDHGFILAGMDRKPYARVQIASVQTLIRQKTTPSAGLVICDEAHLSTANTLTEILKSYPRAKVLGVTATPWRLGGKPLTDEWQTNVVIASPRELCAQGHLCGYHGFSYLAPDLSKVKTVSGDYDPKQAGEAMQQPKIVTNIIEQWKAHASTLSTVVFAMNVEHSRQLCDEFKAAGVTAEHLDGQTSIEQRAAILARVESGQTMVLCNVGVAVEGLDIPRLKCCVLARPTKSLARAIQMMGRVRRPWGGLTARIHDHAFNIKLHGLPDADRDYSLDAKPTEPPSLTQCELCLAMYAGPSCPSCNHENEVVPRGESELVTVDDAESFEFSSEEQAAANEAARKMAGPVRIDWGDHSIGRIFDGTYEGSRREKTQWGNQTLYRVRGPKRDYELPGTQKLRQKMAQVAVGSKVRITYTGRPGFSGESGKVAKEFSVQVDEPDPVELKVCSFEGCGNRLESKGLCIGHYTQKKRGWTELRPLRAHFENDGPCSFDGCVNGATKLDLCHSHYKQKLRGEELNPLRRWRRNPPPEETP